MAVNAMGAKTMGISLRSLGKPLPEAFASLMMVPMLMLKGCSNVPLLDGEPPLDPGYVRNCWIFGIGFGIFIAVRMYTLWFRPFNG